MGLRELRIQSGMTQSQLAEYSGINLRSLQDYEQGHKSLASAKGETLYRLSNVLGYSINAILEEEDLRMDFLAEGSAEQAMRNKLIAYEKALMTSRESVIHFPVIFADSHVDMSRIYPTKQKDVKNVLECLRKEETVADLHLFGSSISLRCNRDSDLDFAVGLTEFSRNAKNYISELIQECCNWNADILWLDRVSENDRIYGDIQKGLKLI